MDKELLTTTAIIMLTTNGDPIAYMQVMRIAINMERTGMEKRYIE